MHLFMVTTPVYSDSQVTVISYTLTTDEALNSSYFDIRLVNENGLTTEGRVEVLYGGLWGTVCDDMWDYRDAQVACRQLGFPYAVAALATPVFGEGVGAIWMDNVECNGTEQHIAECRRTPLDNINCGHSEDAGIVCSGEFPTCIYACWYSTNYVSWSSHSSHSQNMIAPNIFTMQTAAILFKSLVTAPNDAA